MKNKLNTRLNRKGARKQAGQSMVEYTIILVALSLAIYSTGITGRESSTQAQQQDMLRTIGNKYRGYSYAISLAEYPETDDLTELGNYYLSLNKHPELAQQMLAGDNSMRSFMESYVNVTGALENFDFNDLPDDFEDINIGDIVRDFVSPF